MRRLLLLAVLLLGGACSSSSATRRRRRPGQHPHSFASSYPSPETLNNLHITTSTNDDAAATPRIIGGNYPTQEEYNQGSSFVVALVSEYKPGFYAQFCGGTLIEDRFILTAAHCLAGSEVPTDQLYAVIGRRVLTDASQGEIIPVQASFVHPSYDPESVLSTGDIAIVRLAWPTTLPSTVVRPVKLITPVLALDVMATTMATIFGYGRQEAGVSGPLTDDLVQASGSDRLARVDVPLVDNALCNAEYELLTNRFEILPSQICAGYEEGGKSSCQGDSGGPLVAQLLDGKTYQIGLVSWAQGCASPHFPTVFTRISSYLDFIGDKTTLVATSLYQGEGAKDNLLYTGELGNYIFTGVGRTSTLWIDFENLSPPNFVMTVGAFSSLDLTGTFTVDENPFHISEEGDKHSVPLLYSANASALDFATIRINLVTPLTPSQESFAVITGFGLLPANFTTSERNKTEEEKNKKEEEGWYTSETPADWTQNDDGGFVSGPIENSEASCLLKYIHGEGKVSFDWRVSCEEEYDQLVVFVDNVSKGVLSGEQKEWEMKEFEVVNKRVGNNKEDKKDIEKEEEEHTITFCFFKDRSMRQGKDRAELKNFRFVPVDKKEESNKHPAARLLRGGGRG